MDSFGYDSNEPQESRLHLYIPLSQYASHSMQSFGGEQDYVSPQLQIFPAMDSAVSDVDVTPMPLPLVLPMDDSFENFMWNNYNKFASAEDRVDVSDSHSDNNINNATITPMPSTQHHSPLSIDTGALMSSAANTEQSSATSITSPFLPPPVQEQLRPQPRQRQRHRHRHPNRLQNNHSSSSSRSSQSRPESSTKSSSSAYSDQFPASSPLISASYHDIHQDDHQQQQQQQQQVSFKPVVRKRERNRISARKCRQRSKSKLSELEDQAESMAEEHETLLLEIKDLQYELITTQVECMEHIRCRCPEVKQAMSRPAADVAGDAAAAAAAAALMATSVNG